MQENVVSESENKNPEEKDQMIEMVQSQIEAAESSATPKIVEVTGAEFDPEKAAFLKKKAEDNAIKNGVVDEAIESLEEYRKEGVDEIKSDYQSKLDEIANKERRILDRAKEEELERKDNAVVKQEKQVADNIKQGIEYSSIAQNKAQKLLSEIDKETQAAWTKTNAELSRLSLERSVAESEFQSALENFDISYAAKLEKKISELSKAYTQKQAEASEYNNKLNEQVGATYDKWKNWSTDFIKSVASEEGYKKAYHVMEQIKNMTKAEATDFVSQPEITEILGSWIVPIKDYIQRVLR
ncbi:MAG: hypothetical protein IKQ31_02890 [Clostridia bacterium]|nr:hypothetical protein [Clostridia bacterium]